MFSKLVVVEMNYACLCLSIWHVMSFLAYCVIFMCLQFEETALHLAAREGHLNTVKFLVSQFGERVHETNAYLQTCRDVAESRGHRHVVEYLDSEVPTLKSKVSTTERFLVISFVWLAAFNVMIITG